MREEGYMYSHLELNKPVNKDKKTMFIFEPIPEYLK